MSSALSEWELVEMRETLNTTLPGTAVILRRTATSDGQGGQLWDYAAAGTVASRLSPIPSLRQAEDEVAGRVAELSAWILTVPAHTDIDELDRVTFNNFTYEVSNVLSRVPWEISRRVRLEKVD